MKNNIKIIFIFILILMQSDTFSQKPVPCSSAEASQFDFWIGEWDLTYNDTVHATNNISKQLGSCVIEENFNDPSNKYIGRSWSVYSPQLKKWQQTWVDNSGAYLDFTGEFKDGKMQLNREFTNPKGIKVMQRMIFYNITKNTLDWNWESSNDNGATWTVNWKMHYQRKNK
jgi:hypothetical protein